MAAILIAALAVATIGLSENDLATMRSPGLCQFEDGNPDGSICEWIDPVSGHRYVVDSRNYQSH